VQRKLDSWKQNSRQSLLQGFNQVHAAMATELDRKLAILDNTEGITINSQPIRSALSTIFVSLAETVNEAR